MDKQSTCNVCGKPIDAPAERVPRVYRVRANGRELPPQYKHDACDRAYAAEKTGLEKIS